MAKRLIKNTEELFNFARDYNIDVDALEHSVNAVSQALIDKLMSYYDEYYMYIDNGRQMKEAQERNHEIEEEVAAIKKVVTEFNEAANAFLDSIELCDDEEAAKILEGVNNSSFIEATSKAELETALFGSSEEDAALRAIDEDLRESAEYAQHATEYTDEAINDQVAFKEETGVDISYTTNHKEDSTMKNMTAQDIINKAQHYGIRTDNASIEDIAEMVIKHLMFCFQLSLPNCKGKNKEGIMEDIQSIRAFLTTLKEESTMKKTNVHATGYMSKDKIREELKTLGVELSNTQFKNTKRDALLEMLENQKKLVLAKKTARETAQKPAMPIAHTGVPVGDFSMDNAPSNDISKETEVLPETVAETVSQFTRAQCTQVLGRILMDSTAQQVFGTVSDCIARSHVAKVLFDKTMNVVKNGKFTKEKTVFSDTETAAINEFIHKLCAYGYLTLNESGESYSLSDTIKNKKGIWKHEPTGTEYIVDYKSGKFAARGSKNVYKLSDKKNGKKLNRYVLQDTCVFQGFAKEVK